MCWLRHMGVHTICAALLYKPFTSVQVALIFPWILFDESSKWLIQVGGHAGDIWSDDVSEIAGSVCSLCCCCCKERSRLFAGPGVNEILPAEGMEDMGSRGDPSRYGPCGEIACLASRWGRSDRIWWRPSGPRIELTDSGVQPRMHLQVLQRGMLKDNPDRYPDDSRPDRRQEPWPVAK
ncbi:hypothetical protein C8R43DRAFT_956797 [Mycena crocata]|nr:hypothetical protein C8R43DRAFT_956797 [Mycena crocata]